MPSAKTSCFFDTNLLVYGLDPTDPAKREIAADLLLGTSRRGALVLSPLSLNECYRILVFRRAMLSESDARSFLSRLMPSCTAPLDQHTIRLGWSVHDRTRFSYWDSILLASALAAGCKTFFSEDMDTLTEIDGMSILNPFTLPASKLATYL